jgi:hypothetical protein
MLFFVSIAVCHPLLESQDLLLLLSLLLLKMLQTHILRKKMLRDCDRESPFDEHHVEENSGIHEKGDQGLKLRFPDLVKMTGSDDGDDFLTRLSSQSKEKEEVVEEDISTNSPFYQDYYARLGGFEMNDFSCQPESKEETEVDVVLKMMMTASDEGDAVDNTNYCFDYSYE